LEIAGALSLKYNAKLLKFTLLLNTKFQNSNLSMSGPFDFARQPGKCNGTFSVLNSSTEKCEIFHNLGCIIFVCDCTIRIKENHEVFYGCVRYTSLKNISFLLLAIVSFRRKCWRDVIAEVIAVSSAIRLWRKSHLLCLRLYRPLLRNHQTLGYLQKLISSVIKRFLAKEYHLQRQSVSLRGGELVFTLQF